MAAAYIWENNLTQSLTWRFGDPKICAWYYYMQAFLRGDYNAGLSLARLLRYSQTINSKNLSENFESNKALAYNAYTVMSDKVPEAKYNKAIMIYKGEGTLSNPLKSIELLDEMLKDTWRHKIDQKHFLPLYMTKYYYFLLEFIDDITNLF